MAWHRFGKGQAAHVRADNFVSAPLDLLGFGQVRLWSQASVAVAGFAFIALYFVWRSSRPAWARRALWLSLAVGLALGLSQVLRGAHYVSHVAWSAWLCWTLSATASALSRQLRTPRQRRRNSRTVSQSSSALRPDAQTR